MCKLARYSIFETFEIAFGVKHIHCELDSLDWCWHVDLLLSNLCLFNSFIEVQKLLTRCDTISQAMTRCDKIRYLWYQVTFKATNHDGRAATITAPNGTAQQHLGNNKSIGHRFCMSTFHMKIQVFPSFPLNLSSLGANFMSGVCFVQRLQKEPLHRRQKITGHMKNNMNILWHDILFPKSVDKFAIWSLWGHQLPWMPRNWHGLGRSHRGGPVPPSHGAVVHPFPSCQRGRSELRKQSTARAKAPSRWRPERRTWGTWKAGKDGIRGTRRCHETSWKAAWNSMKHLVESASELCPFCPLTQLNHAKSLWLFWPGAAGVAGLSKAAWSSSCSSPSPDPTQCLRIGCDCHRSCRVNEHKCQHCYGSASAALKILDQAKNRIGTLGNYIISNKSLNRFMWTVNLNFHYSNIFTDSPWITWFLCLWGWTTTLIWLDFLLPFPQSSLIGGRMQEERLCPLSASVEPTDMPRPQSFPAKS